MKITKNPQTEVSEIAVQTPPSTKRHVDSFQDDSNVSVEDIIGETFIECSVETAEERSTRLSAYHIIKQKLIARGIPDHEIAFIHDANTPSKKAELIRKANAGEIRVLLGSTSKMGTAMNAQERLIALHHLDAPWRPADVEQREGVGDMVLTTAQVKAVASGNPKVKQHIALGIELTKLDRLRTSFYNDRRSMRHELTWLPSQVYTAEEEITKHTRAIDTRKELREGEFSIQLKANIDSSNYSTFNDRSQAGHALRHLTNQALDKARLVVTGTSVTEVIGQYRGLTLYAHATGLSGSSYSNLFSLSVSIQIRATPDGTVYIASLTDSDPGILQSIDYQLRTIEDRLRQATKRRDSYAQRQAQCEVDSAKPWEHHLTYNRLKRRYEKLSGELQGADVKLDETIKFAELKEEEVTGAPEPEEESDGSDYNIDTSPVDYSECRSGNSLTGLETDPIIAPFDPRLVTSHPSYPPRQECDRSAEPKHIAEVQTTPITESLTIHITSPSLTTIQAVVHHNHTQAIKPFSKRKRIAAQSSSPQLAFEFNTLGQNNAP
jgi:hypothetical protein